MKKFIILYVLTFAISQYLKAQGVNIDSLVKVAAKMPEGIKKLGLYNIIQGACEFKDILKYSGKSIELSDKLLKVFPEKKDSILPFKSVAFNDIGYYFREMGKTSKSVEYFLKSINVQETIKDSTGLITGYTNLAVIIKEQGDTIGALRYLKTAESLAKKFNRPKLICHIQNQLGLAAVHEGNYELALTYYHNSISLAKSTHDDKQIAKTLNLIGSLYRKQNKIKEAMLNFNEALNIFKLLNDYSGQSSSLQYLASICKDEFKDYKKAEKLYLTALDYSSKSHNLINRRGILQSLGSLYHKINRDKEAYGYYYNYTTLKDSLQNEETRKIVLKKELQYNFDKKANLDSLKNLEEQKIKDVIIKANKSQLKQERTQRFALYGGISLLLIFGGFIYNRFKLTQKQKLIIELKNKETEAQKEIIEEKQKEIVDSITYAKRIQYALLAHEDFLKNNLSDYFVLFKPKDIVSGDFYWAAEHENNFYLAACDSTGHGVPGAFMSLLNIGFLNEAIKEKEIMEPHLILNYVRKRLIESISQEGQKDGMDAILICVNKTTKTLTYSAANNEPILIQNNRIIELPKNKMPVGKGEKSESFTLYTIDAQKGDMLYLYTDGFADQFGGPKGKKFKFKQMNELILANSQKTTTNQKEILNLTFQNWMADLEQVDDVCIIGIKI